MKRILRYLTISVATALFFISCSTEKEFNTQFLHDGSGRWVSYQTVGSESNHKIHYVFTADGLGKMWDETDDQLESDATKLKWSISGSRFSYQRWMEITQGWGAYSDFTITDLTATKFQYQNSSGRTYLLQK